MTQREFFKSVIESAISEEMTTYAEAQIAKLDKRNATPTKAEIAKRAENESLKAQIAQILADKGVVMTAAEIAQFVSATTAKASAMLRQMSEAGIVTVSEVKIKNKGKVNGYALAEVEEDAVQALPHELEV